MLLMYILVISLVVLLVFSLSRETGKNTKFARKGADAIAQKRDTRQSFDSSEVIEIN